MVVEKDLSLSEGYAQRIAIIRAFLRKKILILDETMLLLHGQMEIDVLKSVKNLPHQPASLLRIIHQPLPFVIVF